MHQSLDVTKQSWIRGILSERGLHKDPSLGLPAEHLKQLETLDDRTTDGEIELLARFDDACQEFFGLVWIRGGSNSQVVEGVLGRLLELLRPLHALSSLDQARVHRGHASGQRRLHQLNQALGIDGCQIRPVIGGTSYQIEHIEFGR